MGARALHSLHRATRIVALPECTQGQTVVSIAAFVALHLPTIVSSITSAVVTTVNRFAPLTKKSYKRGDWNAVEEEGSFMGNLPLEGLKVVDVAVLFASPTISQHMGDFGAEVIKVEHPRLGDSLRMLRATKNDVPLWWKITSCNKKCVTLDLH